MLLTFLNTQFLLHQIYTTYYDAISNPLFKTMSAPYTTFLPTFYNSN